MGKEIGYALKELQGIETYWPDAELDHADHYIHNSSGNYWTTSGYSLSRLIHLDAGQTINVKVTGGANNSCVIALNKNGTEETQYSSVSSGSIPYVAGTTQYSYTAPDGGMYVAIGYKTDDGFSASIDTGSQIDKNKTSISEIIERLGGVEIPFDVQKYYTLSNGNLVENAGNASKCSTAKISIADYERIYYTGGINQYGGSFIAVFFDDNDTFVGARQFNPLVVFSDTETNDSAQYGLSFVNVLDNIPQGATKVLMQTNKQYYDSAVIGVKNKSYPIIADSRYALQELYGVKGDGITDDTAALQAMFDSSWGDICLKPASYLISNTLKLNAMRVKKLSGNGATLILNAGTNDSLIALEVRGNITGDAGPNKNRLQMMSAGIVIEDLRITSLAGLNALPITSSSAISSGGNGIGM